MSDEIATLALKLDGTHYNDAIRQATVLTDSLGNSAIGTVQKTDQLTGSLRHAGAAIVGLYAGNRIVQFFKDATGAASIFREDLAQFQHVMRNVRGEADAMTKSLMSDAYGRTELQAMRMTMGMTSMAKGMGMADSKALQLSGSISKLSVDIGSFVAQHPDQVHKAFGSALMGFNQALRPYGVFITEEILKARMLEQAKKGVVFASEREARAFALLAEAQKQQADAIGDFAIESLGYSNQINKLGAGLEELKMKFGRGLLEPARLGVIEMNKFIDTLNAMDDSTFAVISTSAAAAAAVGGLYGVYRIGAGVFAASNAIHAIANNTAKEGAAAKVAESLVSEKLTASITTETAAITANTIARKANATASITSFASKSRPIKTASDAYAHYRQGSIYGTAADVARQKKEQAQRANSLVGGIPLQSADKFLARRQLLDNLRVNRETRMAGNFGSHARWEGIYRQAVAEGLKPTRLASTDLAARGFANALSVQPRFSFGRQIASAVTPTNIGSLAAVGKNGDAISKLAGILFVPFKPLAGLFAKTSGALKPLIINLTKGIPLIGRFAPILGSLLSPIGAIVGIGTGIVTGLKLLKEAPMVMEWAIDKIGSLFTVDNIKKAFGSVVSMGSKAFWGTAKLGGDALYGAGQLLMRGVGAFVGVKTQSQILYEQNKKIAAAEAALNERRAANAKREAAIQAAKAAIAEAEEKWADSQKKILEKQKESLLGMMDDKGQTIMLREQLDSIRNDTSRFEKEQGQLARWRDQSNEKNIAAKQAASVIPEDDSLREQFQTMLEDAGGNIIDLERKLGEQKKGWIGYSDVIAKDEREKYNLLLEVHKTEQEYNKSSSVLGQEREKYEKNKLASIEIEKKLLDSEMSAIASLPDPKERLKAYEDKRGSTEAALRLEFGNTETHLRNYADAKSRVAHLDDLIRVEERKRYSETLAGIKEQKEIADSVLGILERDQHHLQLHLSNVRRCASEEDRLRKEIQKTEEDALKTKRDQHEKAVNMLFDFDYAAASPFEKNRLAENEFNRIKRMLDDAKSFEERDKLTQALKEAYDKIDFGSNNSQMWQGAKGSAQSGVRSESAQAREMQNRIWNEGNRSLLSHAAKQSEHQKAMREALEKIVSEIAGKSDAAPIFASIDNR